MGPFDVVPARRAKESTQAEQYACGIVALKSVTAAPEGSTAKCSLGVTSDPFCRAPDEDPPVLAAGGIFQEMKTRRSYAPIDAASSSAVFTFDGTPFNVTVSGSVDVLGEPCDGCDVSFRLAMDSTPVTIGTTSIDQIHLSAGTGTTPIIPLDSTASSARDVADAALAWPVRNGLPERCRFRRCGLGVAVLRTLFVEETCR